jgi:hypothetical protein
MKNNLSKIYIVAFCLCSTFIAFAQDPGTTDTAGTLEGADAPMPIDDYIWVLALIGLFIVFLKFRSYSKKENSNSIV